MGQDLDIQYNTMCPRSSNPFYIVSYYIKWVTTSWTHSISETSSCTFMVCLVRFGWIFVYILFTQGIVLPCVHFCQSYQSLKEAKAILIYKKKLAVLNIFQAITNTKINID